MTSAGRWHRIFALDLRSLALARIMAGLVLFADVVVRMGSARELLSGQGVYPRMGILKAYSSLPLPSLHIANDSVGYQIALLALHAVFSVALLVGYRTRNATLACWLLLVSLHMRNLLVLNSGDALLSALLFWGIFLPWGRVWSWDARGKPPVETTLYLSAACVGLVMQMASVYLFAAFHKMDHPYWMTEGTAVLYAFRIDAHATELAQAAANHPGALRWLSPAVVYLELLAGLALLTPWYRLRAVTLVGCMGMHWTFGAFLQLGIFRWVPWIGLLAMLPPLVFAGRAPDLVRDELKPNPLSLALLSWCAFVWAVNLQSLGGGQFALLPPGFERLVPVLSHQYWGVFTGDGLKDDSWNTIELETRSGQRVDMWLGRPFSREKPRLLSASFPDDRWRKWMSSLILYFSTSPGRDQAFARWWMGEWDRQHPEDPARRLTVWQVFEPTLPSGQEGDLYWQRLVEVTR